MLYKASTWSYWSSNGAYIHQVPSELKIQTVTVIVLPWPRCVKCCWLGVLFSAVGLAPRSWFQTTSRPLNARCHQSQSDRSGNEVKRIMKCLFQCMLSVMSMPHREVPPEVLLPLLWTAPFPYSATHSPTIQHIHLITCLLTLLGRSCDLSLQLLTDEWFYYHSFDYSLRRGCLLYLGSCKLPLLQPNHQPIPMYPKPHREMPSEVLASLGVDCFLCPLYSAHWTYSPTHSPTLSIFISSPCLLTLLGRSCELTLLQCNCQPTVLQLNCGCSLRRGCLFYLGSWKLPPLRAIVSLLYCNALRVLSATLQSSIQSTTTGLWVLLYSNSIGSALSVVAMISTSTQLNPLYYDALLHPQRRRGHLTSSNWYHPIAKIYFSTTQLSLFLSVLTTQLPSIQPFTPTACILFPLHPHRQRRHLRSSTWYHSIATVYFITTQLSLYLFCSNHPPTRPPSLQPHLPPT